MKLKRFVLVLATWICVFSAFAVTEYVKVESPLFLGANSSGEIENLEFQDFSTQLGVLSKIRVLGEDNLQEDEMILLATSSNIYMVTPGDKYFLTYYNGNSTVQLTLIVSSNKEIVIPNIANVDGKDKTFVDLKAEIEQLINSYFPFSYPSLVLKSCGVFQVKILGEVLNNDDYMAWGLTHLSDLAFIATKYANSRKVTIIDLAGKKNTYDLFKGTTLKEKDNNPLINPGDQIYFEKAEKEILLFGSVHNEGTFQLTSGEDLKTLINDDLYGKGLLPYANSQKIYIKRYVDGKQEIFLVDIDNESFNLENMDTVLISNSEIAKKSILVEGALNAPGATTTGSQILSSSSRIQYYYYPGETTDQLVKTLSSSFLVSSDLEKMYLKRGETSINLQADKVMEGIKGADEAILEGDLIIVPFRQMFVTVNGAVVNPGVIAYVPEQTADFYISMANGFSEEATALKTYSVRNSEGKKISGNSVIPNGSVITVTRKTFKQDLLIATSIVGLVATIINIIIDVKTLTE
ncbi:MAG: hypothetical protein PHD05_02245 [Sphaerochaetaceae bacterium]|nr:hypothetical protein [Sphaerochaetaceae bacterium]